MNKLVILFITIAIFRSISVFGQYRISGTLQSSKDSSKVANCLITLNQGQYSTESNSKGYFEFKNLPEGEYHLNTFSEKYYPIEQVVKISSTNVTIIINLFPSLTQLDEVVLKNEKAEVSHLSGVENMGIYEGKKSEVIEVDKLMANVSTNNARQTYARVPGLNIWENDGAGLQLSIGGRGLDPNRTSNFNVRQNGYDISADALGYPESYYTPPLEGVQQIQIVRGAASLQYGTQFGGLLNFVMKKPVKNKKIELLARQSIGSFGFYNSFTSLSGTVGKVSYYSFFQYKKGDGWRPNSSFTNYNFYTNLNYKFNDKTSVGIDITLMDYLAQQPGGLTDKMFEENPKQSNRERNWFDVNWNLFALHFDHKFNAKNEFNLRAFGLYASRYSLGFRPNRVATLDENGPRDLIKGDFKNYGLEARYLKRYKIKESNAVLLTGVRYYHGLNHGMQGEGSTAKNADFKFVNQNEIIYDYKFPNQNVSVFAENVWYINDKLSVIPGLRYENIRTVADGHYGSFTVDLAGNKSEINKVFENRTNSRQFVIAGLGLSYSTQKNINWYTNFSQNYRSITFNDMRISNPSSVIDPNLQDEKGYTIDIGVRTEHNAKIMFDASVFYVSYNNRIGEVSSYDEKDRIIRLRSNIGQAVMMGVETYLESDMLKWFLKPSTKWSGVIFANIAFINSEYVKSELPGVQGNEVEFVPKTNLKSGIRFGIGKFKLAYQYTYVANQFSEASNAVSGNYTGIVGQIPAYAIMDISLSYQYKRYQLQGTVNNLTNRYYYTRRATGYPGPGILPSDGRGFYISFQVKI
jgi:Fe(3+) dicitrate transport protein